MEVFMEITLGEFYKEPVLNVLRQVAITQLEVVRPIGFSVGNSNLLSAGDSVLEDMVEVSSNLSNLFFEGAEIPAGKVVPITVQVSSELRSSDLASNGISVNDPGKELLHVVGYPVTVTVYFYKGTGCFNSEDCIRVLQEANVYNTNIITINARFCKIKSFSFTNNPDNDSCVDLCVETLDGSSTSEVIKECADKLISVLGSIKNATSA